MALTPTERVAKATLARRTAGEVEFRAWLPPGTARRMEERARELGVTKRELIIRLVESGAV